jgi:hypothetical protein
MCSERRERESGGVEKGSRARKYARAVFCFGGRLVERRQL